MIELAKVIELSEVVVDCTTDGVVAPRVLWRASIDGDWIGHYLTAQAAWEAARSSVRSGEQAHIKPRSR